MIDKGTEREMNSWLRRQFFHFSERHGDCKSVVLSHVSDGGKLQHVSDFLIKENIEMNEVEDVSGDITRTALIDAEAFGKIQKYRLQAVFKNSPEPLNRFMFRVHPTGSDEDNVDLVESEPANAKGMVAQAMRHTEAVMKISVMSTGTIVEAQRRTIERLTLQNETLMQKHLDSVSVIEDLMSRRHQRELDSAVAMRKEKSYEQITEKILMLAPIALNKFTGKNLLPEKTTSGEQMLLSFIESLKPEQMGELTKQLSPDQQMLLFSLYENMREKFEKNKPQQESTNG
jgi:hypothetical protein